MIIALSYEIVLKLVIIFMPTILHSQLYAGFTKLLSLIVGIIIILFLFFFYNKEKSNKSIQAVLKILIVCFVLGFLLRLPATRNTFGYSDALFVGEIVGLIQAILLLLLMILYQKTIPSHKKTFKFAAVFVAVMFGIGVIKSGYFLINYTIFVVTGMMADASPMWPKISLIFFLLTHISIIYFCASIIGIEKLGIKVPKWKTFVRKFTQKTQTYPAVILKYS